MFLANGVPHFVQGISGNPFPSPFAKPPGLGDSSPLVNVLWGFGNLVAGALLLHFFWPQGDAAWCWMDRGGAGRAAALGPAVDALRQGAGGETLMRRGTEEVDIATWQFAGGS